ncbi:DUF4282 domain-containing protein [Enterobacter quasiroggenkampii]|nr:DUF4282 domain-containing protein [Enterobacter quasiroggenkampii]MCU6395190.1 DUF4282 domain-containing protein [Enterobacter quasiroggenkampii]MCU6404281.1 DUF4282 domain-containing protein [Enterobacter quasiroggenkampii]MCU6417855.1 DUF4282 domain-containing protein [Enterobacter quasiroggenkampii]
MKQILFFDFLWTPKLLTFVYWLALITVVISSIITFSELDFSRALLSLVGGFVLCRISFELLMLAFKNNEYLKKIAENQSNGAGLEDDEPSSVTEK